MTIGNILVILGLLFNQFCANPLIRMVYEPQPPTPYELIDMVNQRRMSHGLPALIIDPILMGTAQWTSDTMASEDLTWHIGNTRERVIAAGYGAGDIPWATENFAIMSLGTPLTTVVDDIWGDDLHQKPMRDPNYKHVGAGITVKDGSVYYILHAAYTSNQSYQSGDFSTPDPTEQYLMTLTPMGTPTLDPLLEYMVPVTKSDPEPDGSIWHRVQNGQTLWTIAVTYDTKIATIVSLNNLNSENPTIYTGQVLQIFPPGTKHVEPTRTPTIEPSATDTAELPEATLEPEPTEIKTATPTHLVVAATKEIHSLLPTNTPQPPQTGSDPADVSTIIIYGLGLIFIVGIVMVLWKEK
jgi:LysM repeat protein